MTLAEQLAKALESAEGDVDYWKDIAITDFTRELHARMGELGITQGELARRMGTSRPYITKLLAGSNFTLETMVKLAMALDAVVRVRLEGREERAAERTAAASQFRVSLRGPIEPHGTSGRFTFRIELHERGEWREVAQIPYELDIPNATKKRTRSRPKD
jgi:transcriptional regulator with XRE-family HTH domain